MLCYSQLFPLCIRHLGEHFVSFCGHPQGNKMSSADSLHSVNIRMTNTACGRNARRREIQKLDGSTIYITILLWWLLLGRVPLFFLYGTGTFFFALFFFFNKCSKYTHQLYAQPLKWVSYSTFWVTSSFLSGNDKGVVRFGFPAFRPTNDNFMH